MVMKRSLRMIAVLLLVCTIAGIFAACSTTLNGTYTYKEGLVEQSFTFKKDNKVDVSAFGIDIEGEYEIKDGEITITYSLFGLSYDWVKSFKRDGKDIVIDGLKFVKEK